MRDLEAEGHDHALAVTLAAGEISAAAGAPAEDPERAHYSPDDPRYLGSSVRALRKRLR